MPAPNTRSLVERYVDSVWNNANPGDLDELTTEDFSYHLGLQPPRSRAEMLEFLRSTHEAFPDWRVEIVQILSERETVAIRWQGEVTHLGEFHGIPPTGQKIQVAGINFYRIDGGLVAEEWEQTDSLSMLQQMGVLLGKKGDQ